LLIRIGPAMDKSCKRMRGLVQADLIQRALIAPRLQVSVPPWVGKHIVTRLLTREKLGHFLIFDPVYLSDSRAVVRSTPFAVCLITPYLHQLQSGASAPPVPRTSAACAVALAPVPLPRTDRDRLSDHRAGARWQQCRTRRSYGCTRSDPITSARFRATARAAMLAGIFAMP
jgi:hypothetical protein